MEILELYTHMLKHINLRYAAGAATTNVQHPSATTCLFFHVVFPSLRYLLHLLNICILLHVMICVRV